LISSINLAEVKTLPALRDKINEIPGFMASIVQGGTASAPKYYIAVKNGTGASNNFYSTITKTEGGVKSNATGTGLVLNGTEIIKQGVNAEITVDDVLVVSETNSFVDILPGVELTANATTAVGASVTITSKTDTEVLSSAMATLVSGFNVMMETIKQETKYDLDPKKRGGLANESAGRQLMNELRSFTTQELAGYDDEIHTLAELGVRTNRSGSLSLDEATFAAILQKKPEVVEAVLASKKMLTDSRLGVASVTDDVIPGVYTIEKTISGAWTINDESATLTTGILTADAGTSAEGLVISIPPSVANAVPSGYSTTVYYGKGLVERFNTMFSDLSDAQSSLQVLSTNSTKSIDTLAKDQSTLDSRMKQVEERYLLQFARMNAILSEGKNTQESLTSFMEGWRASLKA
jgi:flagellar hook-associated protein 2